MEITPEKLEQIKEAAWMEGRRSTLVKQLSNICQELGYNLHEKDFSPSIILEREEAIQRLRIVCGEFGDNDWDESLHLADIINNHLEKYLHPKS